MAAANTIRGLCVRASDKIDKLNSMRSNLRVHLLEAAVAFNYISAENRFLMHRRVAQRRTACKRQTNLQYWPRRRRRVELRRLPPPPPPTIIISGAMCSPHDNLCNASALCAPKFACKIFAGGGCGGAIQNKQRISIAAESLQILCAATESGAAAGNLQRKHNSLAAST